MSIFSLERQSREAVGVHLHDRGIVHALEQVRAVGDFAVRIVERAVSQRHASTDLIGGGVRRYPDSSSRSRPAARCVRLQRLLGGRLAVHQECRRGRRRKAAASARSPPHRHAPTSSRSSRSAAATGTIARGSCTSFARRQRASSRARGLEADEEHRVPRVRQRAQQMMEDAPPVAMPLEEITIARVVAPRSPATAAAEATIRSRAVRNSAAQVPRSGDVRIELVARALRRTRAPRRHRAVDDRPAAPESAAASSSRLSQ